MANTTDYFEAERDRTLRHSHVKIAGVAIWADLMWVGIDAASQDGLVFTQLNRFACRRVYNQQVA